MAKEDDCHFGSRPVLEALDEPPTTKKDKVEPSPTSKMRKMDRLAYSLIILNLSDKVLRQVNKENTALKIWNKLQSLYC